MAVYSSMLVDLFGLSNVSRALGVDFTVSGISGLINIPIGGKKTYSNIVHN